MLIKTSDYNIVTGSGWSAALNSFLKKKKFSSLFILCDGNTLRHCLPVLVVACPQLAEAEIIEIDPGEESKSLEIAAYIWETLAELQCDRDGLLINLGGGVVTDLGGFCASVFKRGIAFVNLPTTLLGMADASVGGKNGIDFGGLKNMIGTFSQPAAVFVNPEFLKTLPERHVQNGLAEIYKIALVNDKKLWKLLKKSNHFNYEEIVTASIKLKHRIVKNDPHDRGKRKILNFGHTIGHALETILLGTAGELLHGEAIITGMLIETHIAFQKKLIDKITFEEVRAILSALKSHSHGLTVPTNEILQKIKNDKKNTGGKMMFALISSIGVCDPEVPVTASQVEKAIQHYNSARQ